MTSLEKFLQPFKIDLTVLSNLAVDLSETYKHLALTSTDQFLGAAINVLPTGNETGLFLALDIGGSNLRVGFVELLGSHNYKQDNLRRSFDKSWPIEDRFKDEKAEDLFAWIGKCIAEVIGDCLKAMVKNGPDRDPLGPVLPTGITWSFPMVYVPTLSFLIATKMLSFEPVQHNIAHRSNLDFRDSNLPVCIVRVLYRRQL